MDKISVFAKKNHISTRTLHYYDEIGLLVPMRIKGNRVYSSEDAVFLKRILVLKDLGFSLDDIAHFVHDLVPLENIVTQRNDLLAMRDTLNDTIAKIDAFRLDQSLASFDNPIGVSVRKIIGDSKINNMYDTQTIDAVHYTNRLEHIMNSLKSAMGSEVMLLKEVTNYHKYFTEELYLEISKAAFERIVLDNIDVLEAFTPCEKLKLRDAIRTFVIAG